MPKPVRLLLFASAREAVGHGELALAVVTGGASVEKLLQPLLEEHPSLVPVLKASRIFRNGRLLRNRASRVMPGDEVAIHPPYSGG
jgi:molybdopterin converting factor small subunit